VVEALQQLHGQVYKGVTLYNCRGDNLAEGLEIILTKMTVNKLVLEYSEFEADGTHIFQDKEARAVASAFAPKTTTKSSIQSLHLKGLPRTPALGEALKEALTNGTIKSFQWTAGLFGQMMALPQDGNNHENAADNADYAFWNNLRHGLQSCSTLKRLDIQYVEADAMVSMILSGLQSHPSLQFISVSLKDLGSDVENGIRNLFATIENRDGAAHTSSLKTIKFSLRGAFSSIPTLPRPQTDQNFKYILDLYFSSDEQMETLGEGLSRNDAIEDLHLRYHSVTAHGMKILGGWIGNSDTKLRKLCIDGRSIDTEGAQAILNAVKNHPCGLEVVELPTTCPFRREIQHHADLNKAGWSKMLRNESHKSLGGFALWPYVLERASRLTYSRKCQTENDQRLVNAVFHLLRGPAALHRTQVE
jgi:hypothetical protein